MAIKRKTSSPVVVLDGAITSVEFDNFVDRKTGESEYRGRKIGVLTGAGPNSDELEVRVPPAFDELEFEEGSPILMNVEYSEYSFRDGSGRDVKGSGMKFHSFVDLRQFDRWKGLVARGASPQPEKQPA